MGLARLLAASPEDLAATSPKTIKKGILKSDFLRGPLRSTVKAGFQPLGSGPHYVKAVPIITQFSPEVLSKVFGYLDPIWLFQLEAAYLEVRDFLISPAANSVWYNALPAALMSQPDYFQIEFEVSKASNTQRWNGSVTERYDVSQYRLPWPGSLDGTLYTFAQSGDALGLRIGLPELTDVSVLCREAELTGDTRHPPSVALTHPFIMPMFSALRKRNLALGGAYESQINYRRELLGHAHNGQRCYVCYECFDDRFPRLMKTRFGMKFCATCLADLTVARSKIKDIRGLYTLIHRSRNGIWGSDRLKDAKQAGFWLPQVDDILRNAIGIDYATATRKQQYFEYLLEIKSDVCETLKRELRNKIVASAEVQWKANDKLVANPAEVEAYRHSFAPARALGLFLFPPSLLSEAAAYNPTYVLYTKSGRYVSDPTNSLTTPAEVVACLDSKEWISATARRMLRLLLAHKNRVSIFCAAAHTYHVGRIRASFVPEKMIYDARAADLKAPMIRPSYRLFVILSKLHLLPDQVTAGIHLTPKGEALARAAFPKIMAAACVGCPCSNQLAPRGLDAVVRHMRHSHPTVFWAGDWTILG